MTLSLDTAKLAQVVTRAKLDAAQHPRWIAAIARAARELESNPWIEAVDSHTLLIGSPSGNSYVGNSTCQCVAFEHNQPCWHRAAARLWMRYGETQVARPSYTQALAEINELYA